MTAVFIMFFSFESVFFVFRQGADKRSRVVKTSACAARSFFARVALAMHFTLAKKGGFVYAPQAERQMIQLHFGSRDMVSGLTLPTRQPSSQQLKSSYSNIRDVRLEIGRQISAVYKPLAALFYVFEQIADGLNDFVFAYRLEIVSPEPP